MNITQEKKKLTQFKKSFPYYITIRNNYLHCALYFSNFLITITSFNIPKLKEKRGNYYFGFEKKKTQSQAGLIICLSPLKSSVESELISLNTVHAVPSHTCNLICIASV